MDYIVRWSSGALPPEEDSSLRDPLANGDHFVEAALEPPARTHRQRADRVAAILYCVLLAGFAGLVISSSFLGLDYAYLTPMLCSANVVMYLFTGLLQRHLAAQVKKERRQGFLDFSERLEALIQLPCIVIAIGNMVLLLVLSWQPFLMNARISSFLLIRFILLMEILWAAALMGLYIWAVRTHHISDIQPDAMHLLYSALQAPTSLGDLRYIDGGSLTDQQATLLRYQQENLCFLSEEVLRLQEMLSKYECSQEDGTTPQVDVAHLLGAREQELRAVTAERDQLQGEIRMARSFIAEKDSDIQRVKTLNDKYVEENERLRAMLDEWSARTAKLELALEAERLSNAELQKQKLVRSGTSESM
ncbi:uncharacterized protein LOC9647945 [Selaginella moellendorffii]|uniref:uncharacterized protein LOC9647945 n=1 Tax=Selaginella moellendorffii TaxID=88036 RepID=UPI000D1C41FD|nr:uncharacterized protein LOC9647945 [Selaginella moellendorffii]|eukprot:XP_024542314.1 uncharacterized protein LOC9647945 [Selaginella moellendorffii]